MAVLKGLVIFMGTAIFVGAIVLIATVFGWGISLDRAQTELSPLVIEGPEHTQISPLGCDHKTCTFHVQSRVRHTRTAVNEVWVFDHGSRRKIAIVQLKPQD